MVRAWEAVGRAILVLIASVAGRVGGPEEGHAFFMASLSVAAFYVALTLLLAVVNRPLSRKTAVGLDLLITSFLVSSSWPAWFPILLFLGACAEAGWALHPIAGAVSLLLALVTQGLAGWWIENFSLLWSTMPVVAAGALVGGKEIGSAIRRLRGRLEALREISTAIASIPRVEEALSQIVLSLALLLEAEKCVILLKDEATGGLVARQAVLGLTEEEVKKARFKQEGLLAQALNMNRGEPLIKEVSNLSGPDAELAQRLGARSLIVAPLQVKNRPLGALLVVNKLGGSSFSSEDARLLGMLAAHVAMIIENACFYAKVEEERARLQALMASMSSGVLFFDGEGRVILANPLVERFLRKKLPEIVGQKVDEVIEHPELREALTNPASYGGKLKKEVSFQPEGDLVLVLEIRVTEVRAPEGKVLGRVAILHDITTFKPVD